MTDSSILDVFPAASIEARFVVSMAMAKNDVERALRDVVRAGEADAPDFTYRVRLSTGHLIEGLDALDEYSRRHGNESNADGSCRPRGQAEPQDGSPHPAEGSESAR